ncbi:precorrin-6A synthase (deacetylating) [Ancylobacter sp. A5.8]|uniref:precorrin-6A synthase (deacetylating) n=1 Tax=Ancylobacter gelatini TaxID=2919920 RepID=UPI001F4DA8E9|nr:precorrin-6A synthase (deacetylating) [Ancylobacter gelatini]MCJ8144333.1 precorrin-6A synthase (deacetylating) [Ancylobacter gelatini]
MRRLLVIGIGVGNPDHLTFQAVAAMNRAEVFFLLDKGEAAAELVRLREELLARHMRGPYRIARAASPKRDASGPYKAGVADWHAARAALVGEMIARELPEDGTGAFLVWGDPALYDSTLRLLDMVRAAGTVAFETEVFAGISAVQALTAAHGIVLNMIGDPVVITTGRRGLDDLRPDATLVAMLDDGSGLRALMERGDVLDIWWGAYLGSPDQMLAAGRLSEVGETILARRAEARARKGWIMDVWLVRPAHLPPASTPDGAGCP